MERALGYSFRKKNLLDEALATPSCRMEDPEAKDNQRLEFLGDAVLGLLAAEQAYRELCDGSEGRLTVVRSHRVSTSALSAAAWKSGLKDILRFGGSARPPEGSKTYADAVEAVIGAAYLDGGLEAAKTVYAALGLAAPDSTDDNAANPKGALQVFTQSLHPPLRPEYKTLSVKGPPHAPVFEVEASVPGMGAAAASAGSRREAESKAAAALLAAIRPAEEA